jgi:hypothetical protein
MRHADALSRCVNAIEKELVLTQDIIQMEQEKNMCEQYLQQEEFQVHEDGILYRQEMANQPHTVIPTSLVQVVLKSYHELPFTAHQGVGRTIEFIKQKY